MKKKNSDLWTKCQHYKKISFDLNYKLSGREVLKELPLEIEKVYKEIETLRDNLGKFYFANPNGQNMQTCGVNL